MNIQELHQAILAETTWIISAEPKHKEVYGRDLIDLPEKELILYGVKLPYGEGTIELTLATPAAHPTFEWLAEITIKQPGEVEHYLLKPDQTIVETYGKTVLAVEVDRAQTLLDRLKLI
jgi:hypothetical protein